MEILTGVLITVGMYGGVLGYPVLQVKAFRRMRGRWRVLAAITALPMAVVHAESVFDCLQGSNLWPLLLIFTSPIALLYLSLLWFVHLRFCPARS